MLTDLLFLIGGGLCVWMGAEGMVRGAVHVAKYYGISSLIIGLTVVAFGTSAPELVVSSVASASGHGQIALGNVIGSNVINIGLVLGLSALILPIHVNPDVFKRDMPILLFITLAVVAMIWFGNEVGRIDGAILLLFFVGHCYMSFKIGVKEQRRTSMAPGWIRPVLEKKYILFLLAGMIVLAAGAEGMVRGAASLAEQFGMSKKVIGMTVVAFGTSLPELAASIVAAKHGESDLAIGNVVGSNIYNLTLILGTASLIAPISSGISWSLASVDIALFVLMVVVLVPMSRLGGWKLGRVDAVLLLLLYGAGNALFFI